MGEYCKKTQSLRDRLKAWDAEAAIVYFLVSALLAICLYYASQKGPCLTFSVSPIRVPLLKNGQASGLRVLYNGKEINGDVTTAQVALWNAGSEPITADSLMTQRPIKVCTDLPAVILDARVTKCSRPDVVAAQIDNRFFNQGEVRISWAYMEKGDQLNLQITYAGSENAPIWVAGSLRGQREVRVQDPCPKSMLLVLSIVCLGMVCARIVVFVFMRRRATMRSQEALTSTGIWDMRLMWTLPATLMVLTIMISWVKGWSLIQGPPLGF